MVIYGDICFVMNTIINYALLVLTAKARDYPAKRIICLLSAAFGGLYSVTTLYYPPLAHWWISLPIGLIMVMAVFFRAPSPFLSLIVFYVLSAALGGLLYGICSLMSVSPAVFYSQVSLRLLVLCFIVCWVMILIASKRSVSKTQSIVTITIKHHGRQITIHALPDTGNSLSDPITGKPAIIIGVKSVLPLFEPAVREVLCHLGTSPPEELLETLNTYGESFRLIPFKTVENRHGLILAFTPDHSEINGKRNNAVIAICPQEVSDGGAYCALTCG